MKKSRLIVIGLFLLIFPVFFNGQHVQAYTYKHGQNTTLDKIVAKNFTKAFSIMKDKISLYEAVGQNNHPFWWYAIDRNKIDSCGSVAMPNTIIEGGSLTCEEFLIGKGDEWSGLFPHEEIGPRREEEATAYYGKIGYTLEKVAAKKSTERSCLKAEIVSLDKGTEYSVNNICLINGIIDTTAVSNLKVGDRYFDVDGYGCATFRNSQGNNILGSSSNNAVFCDYNSLEDLQKLFQEQANFLKGSIGYDYNFKIESAENKGTQSDSMKKGTQSTVMKKIIGQKTVKTLSALEVYNLYYQYINNSNNVELRCDSKYDFKSRSEEWHHVIIKNNDKIDNNCYVREKRSISYSLAAPTSNAYTIDGKKNENRQYLFSETGKSLKDLAKAINALDLKSILSKAKDTKSTEDEKASEGQSSAEKDKDCYDAGVESMSWVICPALDNTNQTVDAIESQLRNWLQIETVGKGGIFQDEKGKNNIYTGWGIFRNIANIFLIIIFLVVIFSQLTGVGIDNYGIKKILPRLIAMAILINLSYVICQLAVDLSNILGVGLDNLMKGIGFTINGGNDPSTGFALQDIAAKLLAVVAAGGVIGGIAASSGGGVMLVVSLLLAALVALVAVLIFFVMLSARMIIVAVFVVIAPVAFALYILPNTQALFKKWWKIFEAALVVYPICGALYGASYIIKAIVRPDNMANLGFFQGMIGVVAPFLPFLILPSLLKGALAGLGALGGTLTMLGNGLKKGAKSGSNAIQSGIKGSERYKNNMQERARNRQMKLSNKGIDKLENRQTKLSAKGRSLSDSDQLLLARRYQTRDKLENEDRAARVIVEQNRTKGMNLGDLANEWDAAWDEGDKDGGKRLDALTSVINSRYGTAGANEIANRLATKDVAGDKKAQAMVGVLRNNMNHDSTFANNMRSKASDAYGMISDGGKDSQGNYQNLPHFSANNQIATSYKDWSTQSSGTLKRAIDSGALSKEQIGQLLNSTDPSIQSGLQSDESKRDVLQAAMSGATNLGSMSKDQIKTAASDYRNRQNPPSATPTQSGDSSSTLIIERSSGNGPRPGSKGPLIS